MVLARRTIQAVKPEPQLNTNLSLALHFSSNKEEEKRINLSFIAYKRFRISSASFEER